MTAMEIEWKNSESEQNEELIATDESVSTTGCTWHRTALVVASVALLVVAGFLLLKPSAAVLPTAGHMQLTDLVQAKAVEIKGKPLTSRELGLVVKRIDPFGLQSKAEMTNGFEAGLSEACAQAVHDFVQEDKRLIELAFEVFNACIMDENSQQCKDANEKVKKYRAEALQACKKAGAHCQFTLFKPDGTAETEEFCLPQACHDELEQFSIDEKASIESETNREHLDCNNQCTAEVQCGGAMRFHVSLSVVVLTFTSMVAVIQR